MARSTPKITWSPQPLRARFSNFAAQIYSTDPPELRAIRRSLASTPIPETVGARTPKEDAMGLLKLAAEVEHALMVRYLYASISLTGVAQTTMIRVAVQEMGHLVSVQNLLLALGGLNGSGIPAEYHLGRDVMRRASDLNPLPLVLDAVSHNALSEFVSVERPAYIADASLRARVDKLSEEAKQADGVASNPVGNLYAKIYWLFQPSDAPSGPLALTPKQGFRSNWHITPTDFMDPQSIDRFAAGKIEWGATPGLIIAAAHNQTEACAIIEEIIEQGEGLAQGTGSHFQTFLGLVDQFESAQGIGPVLALPRSPYIDDQKDPEDSTPTMITNAYTVLWARLFNIRYSLLVTDIGWTLSLPREDSRRASMAAMGPAEMLQVIKSLYSYLASSHLSNNGEANAGPPFTLLDEQLPESPDEYKARYQTLLGQSAAAVAAIQGRDEYQTCQAGVCTVTDVNGEIVLDLISTIDATRQPLLPG